MTMQSSGITVRILGDDSDLNEKLLDGRKALSKWATAAVAAAAGVAIAITKSTAESAKEINNLSRLVGENTTEFQRNAAAAKSVGIEQEKYADIMKDVRDKVGDFITTGAGPMVDFFEKIGPKVGVTAQQFKNLNGREALGLYVDSLEKANVSQNEMTFFMEAIASDAALLTPLLENSGEGFKALGDRAEQAGAVLSQIDIAKLEGIQEGVAKSQELFKGLTNTIALQLAPVLQGVTDLFGNNATAAENMRKAVEKAFEFTIKGSGLMADGIRGIHVIVKGIEAAFWGLSAVVAEVFEQMARGVDDFVVKPALSSINALIDGVNNLPGINLDRIVVGDSAAVTALTEISDAATAKMKETALELHNLMMEPLPSKALTDFVKLTQETAESTAKALVDVKNGVGLVIPDIPDPMQDPAVIAEQNKADAMLAIYQDYTAQRLASGEDFTKTEAEKAKEFADKMKEIDSQRFNDQMAGASSFFGNLSSLMSTESETLFNIGKAAAIAGAVVDGISAAISSFKYGTSLGGPIMGGAFAAASVAATGVQIAALASTSFGGGGSSSSAAAPAVNIPDTTQTAAAAPAAQQSEQVLRLETVDPSAFVSGQVVNQLAESLVQYQKDGFQLVVG